MDIHQLILASGDIITIPDLPPMPFTPEEVLGGVRHQIEPELIKWAAALAGIAIVKALIFRN